jgi:peptidoglycan/xylan/chitin deacetylase (PgdA/CDA1 family)
LPRGQTLRYSAAVPLSTAAAAAIAWPQDLDPHTLCLTVDVEWAAAAVLDDLRALFDQSGVRATFFVTHAGVDVPNHERGLHPNFRHNGDTYRSLIKTRTTDEAPSESELYDHVVRTTKTFAPEARGVRAHSLFYDSALMPVYLANGIEYECSYLMPLVPGLRPFAKEYGLLGMPTYYADHFDIMNGVTRFDVTRLQLDRPGLKVIDLHPNIVFTNACDNDEFMTTKAFYHDQQRLLAARKPGRGIRTLVLDLLDDIVRNRRATATLGEVADAWRQVTPWS